MKNEGQVKQTPISTLEGIVCINSGECIAPVYKRVFDIEANKNLVKKVDETDLYEFIQASRSSTDLATLQKRFIALGEIPNVDPTLGSNDLTVMPTDIHGVYDMVNDINKSFGNLPKSIQDIFGSTEAYAHAVLDGTYAAKIQAGLQAASQKAPESEVTNNE